MITKFLPYLKAHRWQVALALVQIFVVAAFELLKPWPLQIVIDYVLGGKIPPAGGPIGELLSLPALTLLLLACIGLVLVHLGTGALTLWHNYTTIRVGQAMVNDLRGDLYAHLQRLSLAYHTRQRVGDLMYRVTSDSFAVQTMIMNGLLPILSALVLLGGMLFVLFPIDPLLTVRGYTHSQHASLMESTMSHKDRPDALLDPFNPEMLRLDPSYAEAIGVQKVLMTVPVRKPNKQEFVRVHPDDGYRLTAAIIELIEDREIYLLAPRVAQVLPDEFTPITLFTAINRQNVLTLWPVKLPGLDGKESEWHRSAREAAERAMNRWVRVRANMSLGAYDLHEALAELPEPEWPEISFSEILRIAFRDRYIDNIDHPLLKRLRGEA